MRHLGTQEVEGLTFDWWNENGNIRADITKSWLLGGKSAKITEVFNISSFFESFRGYGRRKEVVDGDILSMAHSFMEKSFARLVKKVDLEQRKRDKGLEYDANMAECDIKGYRDLIEAEV